MEHFDEIDNYLSTGALTFRTEQVIQSAIDFNFPDISGKVYIDIKDNKTHIGFTDVDPIAKLKVIEYVKNFIKHNS